VAKTANLLVHGLDRSAGDRAALLLPLHWQTAAVAMGCWSAGLEIVPTGGADVAFSAADRLAEASASGAEEVVVLALAPLGGSLPGVPVGTTDYGAEVPGYADSFTPAAPVDPAAPALAGRSGAELVEAARAAAGRWGLHDGDRVLSALRYDTLDGWLAGLLVPLTIGGGVVLCPRPDLARLPQRVVEERVTATAGVAVPGVRELAVG
jgi:uncharacterized protein (TIGR03089 family)